MKPQHTHPTKVGRRRFLVSVAASAGVIGLADRSSAHAQATSAAMPSGNPYFAIKVIDEETGRGVPLVELKLTNSVRYFTDSNGIVAFYEPGLMDREVWFSVESPGYDFPKNQFDERGQALKVVSGGNAVLKIRRVNVAERLYRLTGEGIYRDSALVGVPVPIEHPVLNAEVMGQDTVETAVYKGKIYWFFGDTGKPSFPLGNFGTSGATSELPGRGGLDPAVGVNLNYFADESGFSKSMIPTSAVPGPGPKWIDAMMVVPDEHGADRMVGNYARVKGLEGTYERGLVIFNDQTQSFDRLRQFDLKMPIGPAGRPFGVRIASAKYYYFASPYPIPMVRVKATLGDVSNPDAYEGFSCLAPGAQYDAAAPKLDRAADGRLIYGWKKGTPALLDKQQQELIAAGKMKPEERLARLVDIDTGAEIDHIVGTVYWNDYRRRWVMITLKNLEEVWYAEADTPLGPWAYARKVVDHGHYTFYWPAQFPFLDQEGGRVIYLAGTYTNSFSGNPDQIPRYDYNQLLYRLKLEDPRLFLPVPIYRVKSTRGGWQYLTREGVEDAQAWDRIDSVPFLAFAPDRAPEGLVPVYSTPAGGLSSQKSQSAPAVIARRPLFYALPPAPLAPGEALAGKCKCEAKNPHYQEFSTQQEKSPAVVQLYEYREGEHGRSFYSTAPQLEDPGVTRAARPLCRVWRNPQSLLILERTARPL